MVNTANILMLILLVLYYLYIIYLSIYHLYYRDSKMYLLIKVPLFPVHLRKEIPTS